MRSLRINVIIPDPAAWELPEKAEFRAGLERARLPCTQPDSIAEEASAMLTGNGIIAWFQGRSALGHRSPPLTGPYAVRREQWATA